MNAQNIRRMQAGKEIEVEEKEQIEEEDYEEDNFEDHHSDHDKTATELRKMYTSLETRETGKFGEKKSPVSIKKKEESL